MGRGKGGKITISFGDEEEQLSEADALKHEIANDDVINDFLRDNLLKQIINGGSLNEVRSTFAEAQKLGNPRFDTEPLISKPRNFMEG